MSGRKLLERFLANWPAKVVCLAAAAILFVFYRATTLQERYLAVPLEVDPPPGLAIAEPFPPVVRVTVQGEERRIRQIRQEDFRASVAFGSFHREGRVRLEVKVERTGAALDVQPLAVRVDPAEIAFRLERQVEKTVEVAPNLVGSPARGFELVHQDLTPAGVRVRGPRSLVAGLQRLSTEQIDLNGRNEDFSVTASLELASPLLQAPGGRTVEFRGVIREAVLTRTFEEVEVITIDLPPELRLAGTLPRGTIKLQGSQASFEELTPERLRLVLDCSPLEGPGEYLLELRPDIPPGYIVLKYEPQRVDLVVLPKERQGNR